MKHKIREIFKETLTLRCNSRSSSAYRASHQVQCVQHDVPRRNTSHTPQQKHTQCVIHYGSVWWHVQYHTILVEYQLFVYTKVLFAQTDLHYLHMREKEIEKHWKKIQYLIHQIIAICLVNIKTRAVKNV